MVLVLGIISCDAFDESDFLMRAAIQNKTNEINDDLIDIRRDFHQYPEPSGEEVRTSAKIAEYLTNLGLEVWTDIGGYGVVGILKGKEDGKTIAWRADMDAVRTDLPDPVEFSSTVPGVRHFCGHEVHTTIGLGIANVLTGLRDHLKGTVVFIFQPAEENGLGAKSMIEDDLVEIVNPEEIHALHIFPLPVGVVSTKQHELYAYGCNLSISLQTGDTDADIEEFAVQLLNNLSNVEDDFGENFGDFKNGLWAPATMYKDYLTWDESTLNIQQDDNATKIEAFLAYANKNEIQSVPEKIEILLQETEYADSLLSIETDSVLSNEAGDIIGVNNDQELTDQSVDIINSLLGVSFLPQYGQMPGFNDDFAFFQEYIPGVYYLLGGGSSAYPHTADFVVDEGCIKVGVKTFSYLIFKQLTQ